MLILSTFNSDYLQFPLQSLLELFTPKSVNIKYVDKNLIGELLNLKSNIEEKNSYVILFRIKDLLEKNINKIRSLEKNLNLILEQISLLKKEKELPFLVFLCPSSSRVYRNNSILEEIEKEFIKKLNENKIYTLTLSNIKERYGDIEFENPIEEDTHIPYIPKFYASIAALLARKLHAIIQKPFKVIAVDCDNTLWDGVAADLGTQGVLFKEHNIFLQNYLVDQYKKGKIICLCSKNEEQTVLDVFRSRHTEMPLKLNHISKYKINWREKSENIKELASNLNIFPDSFRFIDDNPIEINNVKQIPGIACITMPQSLQACKDELLFEIDEHKIITEADKNRPEFFKQAQIKTALATQLPDPIAYLKSPELGQSIDIKELGLKETEAIERVSQLSGKTNQFNSFPEVKGKEIREINNMIRSSKKAVFVGRIKDNFSPEDITAISMCSMEKNNITIDNFFVSCRSFGRGIEFEMLKHIAHIAKEKSIKDIKIEFKKSDRNRAAGLFLNILSEINKDPSSKSLWNESRNHPWLYACFKFLFKKRNLRLDFNSLELNKEANLTISAQKLIELKLDVLVRLSLKVSQNSTQTKQNKENILDNSEKINEKNLIELKQRTSSLDYLVNKFFIDNKIIKSLTELENRINTICTNLLGEKGQDKSLRQRGLDSFKSMILCNSIYENEDVIIAYPELYSNEITASQLVEYIKGQKKITKPVPQNNNFYNQTLPVSFQQQRIWFAEQKEQTKNSANFHMTPCYEVNKNLEISLFKLACQEVVALYDVFGASFFIQDGSLKQSILAPESRRLNFQEIELVELSLEEAIQLEISKPWTMTSKVPLMHIILFKDTNYYIFFHVHHAIFDAVSLKNFLDTLSELYENGLDFKFLPPQYKNFIDYQEQKSQNSIYIEKGLNYIRREFLGVNTVSTSPTDKFASSLTSEAIRYSFSLAAEQVSKLESLAKSLGVTFYSLLGTLYVLLIASYTYQENITLVTVSNGRDGHPSFAKMVGFFVNLLVHRFEFKKNQLFIDLVKQVNKKLLDSQEFQDIPFNKIQEVLADLGIKDILLSPAIIFQNYPLPKFKLGKLKKLPIILDDRKIILFGGLTLYAQLDINGELNFVFECKKSEYSQARLNNLEQHFKILINACCENPNQRLQDIPLTSEDERKELIKLGRGFKLNYAENDNLVKRFQRSVEKFPDQIALCYDKLRFSYKELDQKSTNLGHALSEAGVKQGDYIGILLEANHLFFIAELAALKIGAVFIPLSKADPFERLKSIIDDAKIKFFIVDDSTRDEVDKNFKECQLISINSIECKDLVNDLPPLIQTMEDKACILYTSGSTGRPKGVILLQKGIFRVVESPNFVTVLPGDKIAQTANQAFDAAQLECWLALNNGACLVLFDKETILDIGLLQSKLNAEQITHIWLTAGLFNTHANGRPDLFRGLKYLVVGGDVVRKDVVLKVSNYKDSPVIINGYGPTETSIFALTHTFDRHELNKFITSPIGAPINNTEIQICTPWGNLAPFSAIGELVIGGEGVAKGYLNLPQLQHERFIGNVESRKYRSGDLVQFDPESKQVMFIGRANEQQVKINGNLVSVEEVRCACLQHEAIKQVEVIIKELKRNNNLVVFYTLNETFPKPTTKELREFLSKRLSDYMIPNHFVSVDKFLINANGKLDKKQFDKYELNKNSSDNVSKVVGDEKMVLKILKEELIGFPDNREANYIEWGLNSLAAVLFMNKLNNYFFSNKEYELTAADLQANPTVESLTSLIKEPCVEKEKTILSLLKKGDPNLPVIVFIHPAGGGISCFNQLIDHITFNNACYGIEDPLLHNNQLKLVSMEDMANNYYYQIINRFKTPIVLVGFSFGGLLAWEIAKSFETKAENNNLVRLILFDTWVVSCASKENKDRLMKDVIEYCAKQREKANIEGNLSDMVASLEKLCQHHQEIGFKFTPKTLSSTQVYLYKATTLDDKFSEMNAEDKNNYLLRFMNLEFFEKKEIRATHYDLLENSAENHLAENFSKYIEEINHKKISKKYSDPRNVCKSQLFSQPLSELNNPQFLSLRQKK